MNPIDVRVDLTFGQALRCVGYRIPRPKGFKAHGYVFALGMRYGLLGVAASHHLLITCDDFEESIILAGIEGWSELVEEHVRWELGHKLPFAADSNVPHLVGQIAALPVSAYLPLYKRLCPLTHCLELVGEALTGEHHEMVFHGWPFFKRKAAMKLFETTLNESAEFAEHFFERRQADVQEVPEIALIGE